jgi:hypothetical protein
MPEAQVWESVEPVKRLLPDILFLLGTLFFAAGTLLNFFSKLRGGR